MEAYFRVAVIMGDAVSQADLNEAALRRTLSRARYQRCM